MTAISEADLSNMGVLKLADIKFDAKIEFTKTAAGNGPVSRNGTNRTNKFQSILFWTPPVPKMPTRNLAKALNSHSTSRKLPGMRIMAEHSHEGWGAGSISSMVNRNPKSLYEICEFLFDKVIVVLDGMTETPFLLRSVTPRARLLFVTSKEPTAYQSRHSDAIIQYDRKAELTDELVGEVAANIKHLVQIHTARSVTSYLNLKKPEGLPEALQEKEALGLDQVPDGMCFVLPEALSFGTTRHFETILKELYTQAHHVLVPSYINLAQEGILAATPEQHIDILAQLLSEGMPCQVVVAP